MHYKKKDNSCNKKATVIFLFVFIRCVLLHEKEHLNIISVILKSKKGKVIDACKNISSIKLL